MSAFNEANHIAGPAIVTFDSQVWYSEGDIDVDIQQQEWTPQTSRFGNLGPRIKSLPVARVSFKPDGQVTAGRASKAFPYTMADVGKSVFGAADKTLVIQTLAGQAYTFGKAAVVQTPSLILAADKTFFDGQLVFMCINKSNVDPTTADSFLDVAAVAYADTSFAETAVLTPGYTAAYGLTPYDAMESLDGFRIDYPISVSEISVNRFGIIGAYLTGVGPAVCRFTPAGMTEANYVALTKFDGASIKLPGTNVGAGTTDLVITGTGMSVTVPKCGVSAGKLGFGAAKERLGELVFKARPIYTLGVPASQLTITIS